MNTFEIPKKKRDAFFDRLVKNYKENECSDDPFNSCVGCPIRKKGQGCNLYTDPITDQPYSKEQVKRMILKIIKEHYGEEVIFEYFL